MSGEDFGGIHLGLKFEALTPEQEAALPAFRRKYLNIACGGGRIDREALESALADAYPGIGKPAPLLFIFDSPAACMIALKMSAYYGFDRLRTAIESQHWCQLRSEFEGLVTEQLGYQLDDFLWSRLRDQLGEQLSTGFWEKSKNRLGVSNRNQLDDSLEDQLDDRLRAQLSGRLGDRLKIEIWDQLWDQLWGQLWYQLDHSLLSQRSDRRMYDLNCLWGSHDLHWIAWARFIQHIGAQLDDETNHRLTIMERISTQCEWWWPYENVVVASERPTAVRWDEQRRLHCETGPAVEYADGYSLFAWHGVAVPKEWITDNAITPQEALNWENMEQRRAAGEILGWHRILEELDARTIDKHDNPEIGELLRVDLPDLGEEQFLRGRYPTGREFAIPVPLDMTSATQAHVWAYGSDNPDDVST